jgi:hypothetical protein
MTKTVKLKELENPLSSVDICEILSQNGAAAAVLALAPWSLRQQIETTGNTKL